MKDLKKYIIWFIIWLSLISSIAYAANTWSIWSLFENISWIWYLKVDSIKDDTIDSSKIKDETITSADIKDWEISTSDLASDSVTSNKIKDGTIIEDDLDESLLNSIVYTTEQDPKVTPWLEELWKSLVPKDSACNSSNRNKFKIANWKFYKCVHTVINDKVSSVHHQTICRAWIAERWWSIWWDIPSDAVNLRRVWNQTWWCFSPTPTSYYNTNCWYNDCNCLVSWKRDAIWCMYDIDRYEWKIR